MFVDQKDLKSNFLQKKNKQKKKIQQNQQQNQNVSKIQKSIKSFLARKGLEKQLISSGQILKLLLLTERLGDFQLVKVKKVADVVLEKVFEQNDKQKRKVSEFYVKKLFFALIKGNQFYSNLAYKVIQQVMQKSNKQSQFVQQIFDNDNMIQILNQFLSQGKGTKLLNRLSSIQSGSRILKKLNQKQLFSLVLQQYSSKKMQIQSVHNQPLKNETLVSILSNFYFQKFKPQIKFKDFDHISNVITILLKQQIPKINQFSSLEASIYFLICLLLNLTEEQHRVLINQISTQYNHLLVLMEDEDDILYFQNKIMNHQKMQLFSASVLKVMKEIFQSKKIVNMFFNRTNPQSKIIKEIMVKSIKMLGKMFQDRKIIFLRSLLSSDELLQQLEQQKNDQFYQGLKMKLMAMDDEQFMKFNLFSEKQWKQIIHTAISKSHKIIKSQLSNPNYNKKKPAPFQNKNQQNLILSGLSMTLELLYKKSLRTKKINLDIFISKDLTEAFYKFNFGTGAQAMEKLLKLYPFAFTFESRLDKFKKQIKEDKKNHDRTLFLQDQVDDELIIHVRRGKQFLDAYQALIHKDLRKKYKLVFFNQQGLEQEGIDGGGLIKEFINRVLKSAFSEVYGLFYQTSQNQLVPNPYSPSTEEYEFIGKLVGKAVYESIIIEQKFVEPFLNLVIGRKNSFEDLQYIDPSIYKSLIDFNKMSDQELQDLQQTFVILDQHPSGINKCINLLFPSKQSKGNNQQNVFVNRQNKLQFIMAYSDFKCNKQLQEKTRYFRKGFQKVIKPEWLTLFNNQELNNIISGGQPNFDVVELKQNCVYTDYQQKSLSIVYFWQILSEFSTQQKSQFLLYVTSCSRPPTLGFSSMKPKMCISRDQNTSHLPTANTCMNVFRLPDYKDKQSMRKKILYAIYSKAGFQFA